MVALPQNQPESSRTEPNAGAAERDAGLESVYPCTAIRYGAMNWIGEFSHPSNMVFRCGGMVVIETERGIELGQQASLSCFGCGNAVSREQIRAYVEHSGPEFYRHNCGRILREATPQDVDEHARLNGTVKEDTDRCAVVAAQMDLDMKIVTAEHLLGGERIVFYFRADGRVDFRQLVRELAHHYQTRIEMRQVGARDEARLVADYEICGRECCCRNFLKKLQPVNMKMAKLQKSTLDPSKVSGRCGRLRCCLRYEHQGYEELSEKLPRVNSRVETTSGTAVVLDRQVLTQLVLVRLERDQHELVIPLEDITAFDLPRPKPEPPPAPAPPPAATPPRARETRPTKSRFVPKKVQAPKDTPLGRDQPSRKPADDQRADQAPPRPVPKPPTKDAPPTKDKAQPESPEGTRRRRRRRRPGRRRTDKPPNSDAT